MWEKVAFAIMINLMAVTKKSLCSALLSLGIGAKTHKLNFGLVAY